MHELLTGETVSDPRHYVGVRLQQGVPLLDADWNELEDIRNRELRAILKYFVGTGVPAGNQGFEISESGNPNEFAIGSGVMLHDGMMAINLNTATYADQPEGAGLPTLSTPPAGPTDRTDIVYLDLWEDEVGAAGEPSADARLINERIGVETATRLRRHWVVRVEEDASDLSGLVVPEGHRYLPLARLERRAGVDAVRDYMIFDLRKRGITIADNLKVPIDLRRGLEVLDVDRYAQMLRGLRETLFQRLRDNNLPYATSSNRDETLILMALQELMNLARVGEVQTVGRSMDNDDALRFLNELYAQQVAWLDLVDEIGNDGDIVPPFLAEYRQYLNSSPENLIKGLLPALVQNDLLASVIAQEELNLWLTQSTGNLPQGSVDSVYQSAIPADENLTAGLSHEFTYSVRADFLSPQSDEDFQVQVTLPSGFGTASADQSVLNFSPPSGEATVTVTVVPSGGITAADLDVSVIAARNATLRSPQPPISLTLNAPPPIAAFFFYAGARLNTEGRLEVTQQQLTRPQGRNILYRIRNDSPTETRTYEVQRRIVPNVADTSGWTPLADEPTGPPISVAPASQFDVLARVDGPKDPDPAPPLGTTGDIVTTAVLTLVDGSPPADPQTPVVITIPFIVV